MCVVILKILIDDFVVLHVQFHPKFLREGLAPVGGLSDSLGFKKKSNSDGRSPINEVQEYTLKA